jgi:hypothetical protein
MARNEWGLALADAYIWKWDFKWLMWRKSG